MEDFPAAINMPTVIDFLAAVEFPLEVEFPADDSALAAILASGKG